MTISILDRPSTAWPEEIGRLESWRERLEIGKDREIGGGAGRGLAEKRSPGRV